MCTFDTLYVGEEGFVVRCAECNHYQVAAGTTCITITAAEFTRLKQLAENACTHVGPQCPADTKAFAIGTPFYGIDFLFTGNELLAFNAMLEEADSEAAALSLMHLFNNHHP